MLRQERIIRVPANILKQFNKEGNRTTTVYFDPNPAVRWLYWRRLRQLLENYEFPHGKRALDYGCGKGVLLPSLSKRFDEVFAIDLYTSEAKSVVDYYRLKNVTLFQGDALYTPFPHDYFSAIFSSSVLEHLKEIDNAIKEIRRILQLGGILLAVSPTENLFYQFGRIGFKYKKPKDHYWSPSEIEVALQKYLKLVKVEYGPFRVGKCLGVYKIMKAYKQ